MARLTKRLEQAEKVLRATGRGKILLILPWDDEPTAEELAQYAEEWCFLNAAAQLSLSLPIHMIGAAKDEITPPEQNILPLYRRLKKLGYPTSYREIDDGHNFVSHRITLIRMVFDLIEQMEQA